MTVQVGVIDIGNGGNLSNIQKAIDLSGGRSTIIESPDQLRSVDKLVIPGVGSFPEAIHSLHQRNLFEAIKDASSDKLVLGICLGMQLFAHLGFEFKKTKGFNFIYSEVKKMECSAPVPHMGFNSIKMVADSRLLKGLDGASFYFMHSFEMVAYTQVVALTRYSEHEFVSAVERGNIFGVQFHPEKSRDQGLQVFQNFLRL